MWQRKYSLPAAALTCLWIASMASAQVVQYPQYRQGIDQRRSQFQQRYGDWDRDLGNRYGQWRGAPAAPTPDRQPNAGITLRGGGIDPGTYNLRLPFGLNVRVNVPQEQQSSPPRGAPRYVAGAVERQAGEMERVLRSISHYEMRRLNHPEIASLTQQAIEQIGAVRQQAEQGASPRQLSEQFQQFDDTWHQLAHRLRNQEGVSQWALGQVGQIDESDERLHQILRISPARGYDRLQVAALTSQLASQVRHLVQDVELEMKRREGRHPLQSRAERALRRAEDLDAAVQGDEPLAEIVDEYERFDETWHDLVRRAQRDEAISRHLWRAGQQVNQIDRQLHELLYVDSPVGGGRQRAVSLARSLSMSTSHLVQLLRDADGESSRRQDFLREAEDLSIVADDFHRWLQQSDRSDREAGWRLRQVTQQWQDVNNRLQSLGRRGSSHIQQHVEEIQRDLERLQAELQG